MDGLASVLGDLMGAANKSEEDSEEFQKAVEQNKVAVENLLSRGRDSGKVPNAAAVLVSLALPTGALKLGLGNGVHAPSKCRDMHVEISVQPPLDASLVQPDSQQSEYGRGQL